jgi:hypothetical protein
MPTLDVIFRAERTKDADVTAVFPSELGACNQPHTFVVYAHVGQHGSGSHSWYRRTRPARPEEYAALLDELKGIYGTPGPGGCPAYELRIVRRMTRTHDKNRQSQDRHFREIANEH